MIAIATLPVEKTQWYTKGSQKGAKAFVNKLRDLCDQQYGTCSPEPRVYLTRRHRHKRLGWYESRTGSIYVWDKGLTEYGTRTMLIHELAHYYQDSCPTQEGNREKAGQRALHGPVFQLHRWRLRMLAYEAGMFCFLEEQDTETSRSSILGKMCVADCGQWWTEECGKRKGSGIEASPSAR